MAPISGTIRRQAARIVPPGVGSIDGTQDSDLAAVLLQGVAEIRNRNQIQKRPVNSKYLEFTGLLAVPGGIRTPDLPLRTTIYFVQYVLKTVRFC